MEIFLNEQIYDYYILKYIENNDTTTMRKIANHLFISLGSIHSKIESLLCRNFINFIDISNGSKKKKYKYTITDAGYVYQMELIQKLRECILSELEYIRTHDIEKLNYEYSAYQKAEEKIFENSKVNLLL
jgi:DNA-binding MarR family transcriptional regulator